MSSISHILLSRDQISARVHAMGASLAADLQRETAARDAEIVIIPILTGALVFTADLIRQMPLKLRLRVVAVSSYPGTSIQSKGAILASEIPTDLTGKHVVLIDDILDSGQTLGLVREMIERQSPASTRVCVLLRKPDSVRKRPVVAEYVGFDIPDEFVIGYGLDYDGFYRNLPEVAVLKTV